MGRKELGINLVRPAGYSDLARGKAPLLPGDKLAFTFNFPGEGPIATNSTEQGRKNIGTVLGKIESLCGKPRTAQASSVMTMVSQSALSILRGGLSIYGIETNERGACDFTRSKNGETGEVTIKYSSPEALPFKFEWTATVGTDGYVTTTPMRFAADKAFLAKDMADTAQALKNVTNFKNEPDDVKERIANLVVENAGWDPDLMALLRMDNGKVACGLILDEGGDVRSDEKILAKLEALRKNVEELRAATKGDKRAFEIGLQQLTMLEGNALQPGGIAKMCETVAKADIGAIRNLSKDSSPQDVFNAICRMHAIVQEACIESRIMTGFDKAGGLEVVSLNRFVSGLVFARCDTRTLEGIRDAIYNENGMKVKIALDELFQDH